MWLVSQIGAREHYAVARALHEYKQLGALLTDLWIKPESKLRILPGLEKLRDRFHTDIPSSIAWAPNLRSITFEVSQRIGGRDSWTTIQNRHQIYQQRAIAQLHRLEKTLPPDLPKTLFSYSYAARNLFEEAKQLGWKTVLGQIDPGPREHDLVSKLGRLHPDWTDFEQPPPPPAYWERWREECDLADEIIVNSAWSRKLLAQSGVPSSKMRIIPLAFEPGPAVRSPDNNTSKPLRLLFLGQAILRKGIHDLVKAAEDLNPQQWHIDVVGPHPPFTKSLPSTITFHGPSPRSKVSDWYARADVFIIPTHSDGFAITQLEAMSHGLPVIATPCCGEVVQEGVNGWIIPAGSPDALTSLLHEIVSDPEQLLPMKKAAQATLPLFSLNRIAESLLEATTNSNTILLEN